MYTNIINQIELDLEHYKKKIHEKTLMLDDLKKDLDEDGRVFQALYMSIHFYQTEQEKYLQYCKGTKNNVIGNEEAKDSVTG